MYDSGVVTLATAPSDLAFDHVLPAAVGGVRQMVFEGLTGNNPTRCISEVGVIGSTP